jgi:hypothetical protein
MHLKLKTGYSQARPLRLTVTRASPARSVGGLDTPVELVNGAVTSGPDLSVTVNGLKLPNPFVIASGPPGMLRSVSCATKMVRERRANTRPCNLKHSVLVCPDNMCLKL